MNFKEQSKNYQITTIIYALQAFGLFVGFSFLIAVIINYIKRDSVRGTVFASHFTWQIRTFWVSLFWYFIGFMTIFLLIGYLILAINHIWVIYRVAKGWIYLYESKPIGIGYQPPGPTIIDQ